MRKACGAIAVAAVSFLLGGCGGDSNGTTLPSDTLDHDASALFEGRWLGTLIVSTGGQTQSVSSELDVSVAGRNTLGFPGFCGDGGGPTARVTSDSAFTIAGHSCPIPTSSCTVTWQIRGGSGSLSAGTIHLSADGPASGCNLPDGSTLSIVYSGTKPASPPPPPGGFSISSLNPSSVNAGSPGFTLQVSGGPFPTDAVLSWNGSPRSTTFSGPVLGAQIFAADVANAGTAQITVASASLAFTSQAFTFNILGPAQPGVTILELPIHDMVWDPARQKIYASLDN